MPTYFDRRLKVWRFYETPEQIRRRFARQAEREERAKQRCEWGIVCVSCGLLKKRYPYVEEASAKQHANYHETLPRVDRWVADHTCILELREPRRRIVAAKRRS
jgi:hypothetical protein